jgi:uncharacterized protein involved in outer membrane biogenesis
VQATLLGVGIAIILALVAALVGPHFVDWTQYRTTFEAEASRLVGAPVRIAGPIDLRILPSPSLKLARVEVGAADAPQLAARELHMEAALGALVRGELRASELRIVGPEVRLGLAEDGRIAWPGAPLGFSPDQLTVERVAIENGRAVLADAASGTELELERFWFNGEMGSLLGPVKGAGGFTTAGERYGYRLNASRVDDNGAVKLRLGLDPADRPLVVEADGQVTLDAKAPRFEGTLSLVRLAGAAVGSGPGIAITPWRATSRVTATPRRALLEEIDYQYGPEERALKLGGTAEVRFGRFPRAEGILTARQIDIDHTLTPSEGARNLPLAAVKSLIEPFGSTYRPPIPVKLGVGIDTVTLAGGTLLSVRGDLKTTDDGWDLETFEFRAPGFAQVRLSGHLALAGESVTFKGPIQVEASDPKTFLAWLEGRSASPVKVSALKASGDLTLGPREVAVDRLKVEVDKKIIEGRLAYAVASDRSPRLDAELRAGELDVDGVIAFARAAFAGSAFERPGEIGLVLDINRAIFAGQEAKGVSAKLKLDDNGLAIDRARIASLGETSFDVSGRIDGPLTAPRGALTLDIDGRNLDAAAAVLARFAPEAGERLRQTASRLVPLRLRATLAVEPAAPGAPAPSSARLALTGSAKGARLRLAADATGDAATRAVPALRLDGEIAHDDGSVVITLLGLDRAVAVERRPAAFRFNARGAVNGSMAVEGTLTAGGLESSLKGTLREISGDDMSANLEVSLRAADASPFARAQSLAVAAPLPAALRARVTVASDKIAIDDLAGTVADTPVRGKLTVGRDGARIDGDLAVDVLDGAAAIAAMTGAPRPGARREGWSPEPFGDGLFGRSEGRIAFRIARAPMAPLNLRQLAGVLRLGSSEIALEELQGLVDAGRVTGEVTLQRRDGLEARGRITLTDIDAATLLPEGARAAITGKVSLQAQGEASGMSPAAMIGSLRGSGTLTMSDAEFGGLNPRTFEAVTQAVDKGLTIDAKRIGDVIGTILDGGRLAVPRIETTFTINGGNVRLGNTIAKGKGADLALSGSANLADGAIEARVTLAGPPGEDVTVRPEVYVGLRGPAAAPKRNVDVAALSGWLMLRSIERQAKQLEAIEAERRKEAIGSVPPAALAAPAAVPASPADVEAKEKQRPVFRAPRAATAPPAVPPAVERAPALPPPLEIGPAPGRRPRAAAPDGPQTMPRPPAFVPPAVYSRPLPLDPLVNPQR